MKLRTMHAIGIWLYAVASASYCLNAVIQDEWWVRAGYVLASHLWTLTAVNEYRQWRRSKLAEYLQ